MTAAPEPLEDLERWDDDMKGWAARTVRNIRHRAEAGTLLQLSPDLPNEEWRPVVGAPNYQVSDQGRVRFLGTVSPRFRLARDLKLTPNGKGYLTAFVGGRNQTVHRLVALAFIPNPEEFPLVRHLNDEKGDNRAENIAWGTAEDNWKDAQRNGVRPTADRARRSTPEYRAARRARYATDLTYRANLLAADRARRATPEYRAAQRARRAAKRAELKEATQ